MLFLTCHIVLGIYLNYGILLYNISILPFLFQRNSNVKLSNWKPKHGTPHMRRRIENRFVCIDINGSNTLCLLNFMCRNKAHASIQACPKQIMRVYLFRLKDHYHTRYRHREMKRRKKSNFICISNAHLSKVKIKARLWLELYTCRS